MVVVGRIARAHGLRGQVIVDADTDFPSERFQKGAELFVERGGTVRTLTLTSVRLQRDRPVIGLSGVDSIDEAETLAGRELRVPLDRLVPLASGTFYHHELVGCRVETEDGHQVGVVAAVEGTYGASRLVVKTNGRDVLVPLAADICPTIDVTGRRIVIRPPDGLLDLNP